MGDIMLKGWVIFANRAAFNIEHEKAKQALLPLQALNNGQIAPQDLWFTDIAEAIDHPTNGTVVSYINGGWDENLKEGFTFYQKDDPIIQEYFPEY